MDSLDDFGEKILQVLNFIQIQIRKLKKAKIFLKLYGDWEC